MAIPALPGGLISSTRETHLFALKRTPMLGDGPLIRRQQDPPPGSAGAVRAGQLPGPPAAGEDLRDARPRLHGGGRSDARVRKHHAGRQPKGREVMSLFPFNAGDRTKRTAMA